MPMPSFDRRMLLRGAAVGGDEDGILVASSFQVEQSAKTAKRPVSTGALCRLDEGLNHFNKFVSSIDINAGIAVGD